MKRTQEKQTSFAYHLGLWIKATQASLEIVAGILFYIINTNKLTTFILTAAHGEIAESPHGMLPNLLIKSVDQFSAAGKYFIAFYLLSHGVVKLFIIVGLFLKKPWAYPVSVVGFSALIFYQTYHFLINHSMALLLFTIMDLIILGLIIYEHRKVKILDGLRLVDKNIE